MTPVVNTEENYIQLVATQTGNVEGQYDDIIEKAATSCQVQPASNEDRCNGSTVGQLATAVRAEIVRPRRMRLFMLTVIIVTFVIAVAALVLVIMKMADGEGSAAPKQETKAQGKRNDKLFSHGSTCMFLDILHHGIWFCREFLYFPRQFCPVFST